MTRDETIAAIKVMQAYVHGEEIEEYQSKWPEHLPPPSPSQRLWLVVKDPKWSWYMCSYRAVCGTPRMML